MAVNLGNVAQGALTGAASGGGWMGALIGGGAALVGGLLAEGQASGDRRSQDDAMQRAIEAAKQAGLPPDLSARLVLDEYKKMGVYTPELEERVNLNTKSAFEGITEDSRNLDAQRAALSKLQQVGQSGFRPEDMEQIRQMQDETNREANAKVEAIKQSMQARGMGGSGAELMAELQGAQSSANRQNQGGLQIAGEASRRALEAMRQSGELGGRIREQDYNVASNRAKAADELNRFNTEADINRQQRNVTARNLAQLGEIDRNQKIADANIAQRNAETRRQSDALGENWENKRRFYGDVSGAELGQARYRGERADRTAQQGAAVGAGFGNLIAAVGQNWGKSDEKKDTTKVEDTDAYKNLASSYSTFQGGRI